MVVKVAVRLPAVVGLVENVTVIDVELEVVTDPMAPLLKTSVLLLWIVSKPNPLIVTVVAFAAKLTVLLVMTGMTVATCMAVPLFTPLVVMTAVKFPAMVGFVEKETLSVFAVAAVTVPTAASLKTMVLFPAIVSKPKPWIVKVDALAARLAIALVTTGLTDAT